MIAFANQAAADARKNSNRFNASIERKYFGGSFPGNDTSGDPRQAGYDAAKKTEKRRSVPVSTKSEDNELPADKRSQLLTLGRDCRRNMAIAAWAIRKHLDYVASFTFKASTGNGEFDDVLEKFVRNWGKKENFDVARRHPLKRWIRIAEASRTLDGDVGVVKLASKKVQAVEGDRIRNFSGSTEGDAWVQGVQVDTAGGALAYAVGKRKPKGDGFEFERVIPIENMILHGYFDRFDQYRGISPIAAGLNSLRDVYECGELALAKMKVAQLFALAIFSNVSEDIGVTLPGASDADDEEEAEEGEEADDAEGKYKVDLGGGPIKLELQDRDRAEFLESKSPSVEFQQFVNTSIAVALKSLDIPYTFYDESFTNYSGGRQALLQYEDSAESKRSDNRELLDALTRWRLALAIADGELTLPAGVEFDALEWEWVSTGIPWIDPLKEINASIAARNGGFDSTPSICKVSGKDAYALAKEEADYQAYRKDLKLPHSLVEPGAVTIQEFSNAPA
ncbi:MAG: phage portal protein [Planctomycetia bacterium]|nr:phage portal protein [Planctomycetia bacterium]